MTTSRVLEGVMVFPGTIHALRSEKRLKGAGIACKLVPTPRELSSTCALALAFARADVDEVAVQMQAAALRHDGIWIYPAGGGEPVAW